MDEPKIIASEACHWYSKIGDPVYEVPRSDGKGMRPTTLRDARKLGLVPSVTSVLQLLSKPGLEIWKANQILLSAATSPHDINMLGAAAWAAKVLTDAQAQAEKAMQFGTEIHGAMERFLTGYSIEEKYNPFIIPVYKEMSKRGMLSIGFSNERSFAHPIGYGGKIDFNNIDLIIDFKTKEFTQKDIESKKQLAWPEHCWQLGAYRYGLQKPQLKCLNIFISTSVPGLFHFHEWKEEEIKQGVQIFLKTLELWKLVKRV